MNSTIKKIIGITMIVFLVAAITAVQAVQHGMLVAITALGVALVIIALVSIAAWLIASDE